MFSEPSKAEQIIEDAKAELWNALTEEVKQLMDDANEASTKANMNSLSAAWKRFSRTAKIRLWITRTTHIRPLACPQMNIWRR